LLGEQGQDHEAKVAVVQEAPDPAAAMTAVARVCGHVTGPGMAAALFALLVKVMMSVHVDASSLSRRYRYI
jgi:hypothetical protein